jgi:hypothetical protein
MNLDEQPSIFISEFLGQTILTRANKSASQR